tara:strand:+ start:723 stop:872 length:150 start_codon:yes stop_codon:yes gene_type:complete
MSYSEQEAPVIVPIEYKLMKELGMDRSNVHKTAIKEFWNRRQQSTLTLI